MESKVSAWSLLKSDAVWSYHSLKALPQTYPGIWFVLGFVLIPAVLLPLSWASDEKRYWEAYFQLVAANLLQLLAFVLIAISGALVYRVWTLARFGKSIGAILAAILILANFAFYAGIRELPGIGWRIEARDSAEYEPGEYH